MTEYFHSRMNDPDMIAARVARLCDAHVAPLEAWRRTLLEGGRRVPHVDPADGGIRARLLLLLETPGPGNAPVRFVSRDNPTGTAANLRRFMTSAGIARADTVLWNTVPWIVHAPGARNRALRRAEVLEGLSLLAPFIALLPQLRAVVLAGRVASQGEALIRDRRPDLHILTMPHPSPTHVCTSPDVSRRIAATLDQAAAILGAGSHA